MNILLSISLLVLGLVACSNAQGPEGNNLYGYEQDGDFGMEGIPPYPGDHSSTSGVYAHDNRQPESLKAQHLRALRGSSRNHATNIRRDIETHAKRAANAAESSPQGQRMEARARRARNRSAHTTDRLK